jgi:hypothetical protein
MYMLAGGSDASNVDPYATKPAGGRPAPYDGRGADRAFFADPAGPNPDTTRPYVMWAGTPYQHLMAPMR